MNPSQNPSALRSKKMIMDTLLQLMEQYPYPEITVKHIILEAAVSRKTFYRNFLSKDDVLNSCIDIILYDYFETLNNRDEYSFLKILDIIFAFCEKNRELLFLLRNNELLYLLLIRLNHMLPEEHRKITRHIPGTDFRNNNQLLPQYVISFNIGGIWNIIAEWIENDMQDDITTIKETLIYYLSNIKSIDLRDI